MIKWQDLVLAAVDIAIPLVKRFEGFRDCPYKDSAGIPTIGYGTIVYPNGKPVTMEDLPTTDFLATAFLDYQMGLKAKAIAPMLQRLPSAHQGAAMWSLAYNIGTAGFHTSSVLKRFNLGDIPGAADAFLMWDKATVDGQHVVIDGLHNRRLEERAVFLTFKGGEA